MGPQEDNLSHRSQLPSVNSANSGSAPRPGSGIPQPGSPFQAVPPQEPPITDQSQQIALSPTHDLTAEDLDLIEKEWVVKAKEVVNNTQGDPYLQSQELNKIKADYIKKRYNRTIKSNE